MDVKNYREMRKNMRRKLVETGNRILKDQIENNKNINSSIESHSDLYNKLPVEESKRGNQGAIIPISIKKYNKLINLQINTHDYPYLLLFKEIGNLSNDTINSMRRIRSTAFDSMFLEFMDNAITFASSLLNSSNYLDSSDLDKLTTDLEAKIASEPNETIQYKNEIPRIRKMIYNYIVNQINNHMSGYNLVPAIFFGNEDFKFLYWHNVFEQFEHISPIILNKKEIELLRIMISTYGVSSMEEWNNIINNYFNKARSDAIIQLNKISKSPWFMAYASLLINNIYIDSCKFINFFKGDLEKGIIMLIKTNAYPFLFERETIIKFADSTLDPSTDFNFFILLSDLYNSNNYPDYNVIFSRIKSKIVEFFDSINLISDKRFMIIPAVTEPPSEFYGERKTSLFIVTTYIKNDAASQLLLSDKNVAIIIFPPNLFGFNIPDQRDIVKILINTPELQYDKSLNILQNTLKNNINLICNDKKCEVITPVYDYMVKDNNEYITLMEVWLKHTSKAPVNIKQVSNHLNIPKNNNPEPLNIKDFSFISDFLNSMDGIDNIISFNTGTTVIVYDENKKGIEDSLESLTTEIAAIQGYEINPIAIKSLTEFQKYKISDIGENGGIFVIGKDVCSNMDDDMDKTVKESLNGIMGYKYSFIIVPNCFYIHYISELNSKPLRVIMENIDKKIISALTFAASGLYLKERGYSSLPEHKKCIGNILSESRRWLRENYINLDNPNEGSESDIHRNLKALGVLYLVKDCSIDPSIIKVENQFDDEGRLKPDISVGTEIIMDAKSSLGKIPSDEIREVSKYSILPHKQISVIMKPLPVILDIIGVIGRLKCLNSNGENFNVLLPVNSSETELPKLMQIGDYLKEVDRYYKELKDIN